jgi:hypothetical protein
MKVRMTGHNGARYNRNPLIEDTCGKPRKKKSKRGSHR